MKLLLVQPGSVAEPSQVESWLRCLGHEVTVAPPSAVAEALTASGPAVALVECAGAQADGPLAVLRAIRATPGFSDTYVVALNVEADSHVLDDLVDGGIDDVLSSPVTELSLRARMRITSRRAADRAFDASGYLRSAIDASSDAITILDLAGDIVFASRATELILGWPVESLLGTLGIGLIVEEDQPMAAQLFAEVAAGNVPPLELVARMRRRDGELVPIELSGRLLRDGVGHPAGVVVIARDVSARLLAESSLHESQERFQRVVEASRDLIGIIDPAGTIEFVSPAHSRELGYGAGDLIGRQVMSIVHPDDRGHAAEALRGAAMERRSTVFETRLLGAAGDWLPFEVAVSPVLKDGSFQGVVTVARDLRERHQTEAALREAEARFRHVLETSQDLISMVDESGVYRFVSPSHRRVLGYAPEELLGRGVLEILHPDEIADAAARFQARNPGDAVELVIVHLRHKNGSWIPVEVASSEFRDANGSRTTVAVGRDVRAREAAERARHEAEERLRGIVESTDDLITIVDDAGLLEYVSRSIQPSLGYTAEEMIGRHYTEFFHPAEVNESLQRMALRAGGQQFGLVRSRVRHRDGHYIPFESATSHYRETGGRTMTVSVSRDVSAREAAVEAIRESEERFAKTFHLSPLAALMTRFEDGMIVDCNERFAALTGWAREELIGRTTGDIYLWPEVGDREALMRLLDAEGTVPRFDTQFRMRSGEVRQFRAALTKLTIAGEVMIFGILEDVTERREAAQTVARLSATLKAEHEASLDGILVVDPHGNAVTYNQRFLDIWNLTAEVAEAGLEARTQAVMSIQVNPERSVDLVRRVYAGAADAGEERGSIDLVNGRTIEFYTAALAGPEGTNFGRVWYYRDVTERRRAEAQLSQSEERFRRLVEFSPSAIVVHQNQRVVYANAPARELLGLPGADAGPESLQSLKVLDFVHPADRARVIAGWRSNRTATVPQFTEVRAVRRDGSNRDVEVASAPTIFAGEPAIQTVIRDITGQKRAQEERLALERKLLEAQKLESLGVLAGGIAHDFNNLLVAVMGNAGLALMETPERSPVRVYLDEIETAAQRAADLARQMLAYSGKGRFVVAPLSLSEIVAEMTHLLKVSLPRQVALSLSLDEAIPLTDGDATQMRQIVMNLVINAGEAIGDRPGAIAVRTGVMEVSREYLAEGVHSPDLPGGSYVFLEVSDSGSGMDEVTLARIFEPFFTTKFAGRGLGLAAVLGIVRGHRGALRVTSAPAAGTTFQLLLPVSTNEAAAAPATESGSNLWRPAGSVLVVDDEAAVRSVATQMIERLGIPVIAAGDGEQALALFRAAAEPVALVLLDMMMPGVAGPETLAALRAIDPAVRVVAMSGYSHEEAASHFEGAALSGFVQKPFTVRDLTAALRRAFEAGM